MSNGQQSNPMGLTGFIVSLVGFIACQPLCLLGVILSLVGMGKEPRGFAIAGLIIGAIGSLLTLLFVVLFAVLGAGAVLGGLGLATAFPWIEAPFDMSIIAVELAQVQQSQGAFPPDLNGLSLDADTLVDGWGNPYQYRLIDGGNGFELSSMGPDGIAGTQDDITWDSTSP